MVEMTIRCDRCRCVIAEDRSLLRVESGPLRQQREQVDLCTTCASALTTWLTTSVAAPAPDREVVHAR
jgi:hypothetical protein